MDNRFELLEEIDQLKANHAFGALLTLYDTWIDELRPLQDVYALEYARARYERGETLTRLGRYIEAVDDYLACAEVLSYHFGLEDIRYAMTLVSLARAYHALNESFLAEKTLEQALQIYEGQVSDDDLRYLDGVKLKTQLLNEAGHPAEALALIDAAIALPVPLSDCRALNSKATFMIESGRAHHALGNEYEAEQAYLNALALCHDETCAPHLEEAAYSVYYDLASLYYQQGQIEHADRAVTKAIGLARSLYGEESSAYLNCVTLQSNIKRKSGADQTAAALTREALDRALDFSGDIAPEDLQPVSAIEEAPWQED